MTWGPHYHVGYVVPDLERAMAELGESLRLTWTPVRARPRTVHLPDRDEEVTFRVTFSVEGPPHVELIEAVPGTPWAALDGAHHVGHWADDVEAEAGRLAAGGLPLVAHADSEREAGRWRWSYHDNPAGGFVELVDALEQDGFAERISEGRRTDG